MPPDLHGSRGTANLVDVLDRVLDKGLVVAGDIKISLAEVELLTIRIRLLVCSLDKAQEIGLDWWRYDRNLSPGRVDGTLALENADLKRQVQDFQQRLSAPAPGARHPRRARKRQPPAGAQTTR